LAGYADVLGDLWRQGVAFHREARAYGVSGGAGSPARRILESGGLHTPFTWVAVAAAVLALAALVVRRPTRTWPLWSLVVVAALYLVWQKPLFDHHLVLFAAPLAVAAGATLGAAAGLLPRPALGAAAAALGALVAAAALVQQHRRLAEVATGPPPDLAWAS